MEAVIPISSLINDDRRFPSIKALLEAREYPRSQVATILGEYNHLIGNDQVAHKNIEALKNPKSVCVVTGQQLGFMGGPAYTILKGIRCLQLAKETGAVPIYWLASEDHDVEEIDHTYSLNAFGNLEKHRLHFPKDRRPVEDLELTEKNIEAIHHYFASNPLPKHLFPTLHASYSLTMANFLARLFAGTGMVFLEPRLLRSIAAPFFCREIKESETILNVLQKTSSGLEEPVISFKGGTNLFMKDHLGIRLKVKMTGIDFQVGMGQYSIGELLEIVNREPQRFSPNVAARPLLQSLLLPTLAYVAGPTEVAYFKQLVDYFAYYQVIMPAIIPRISATMLPPFAADILQKCGLNPQGPIPHHWIELLPETFQAMGKIDEDWSKSLQTHLPREADTAQQFVKHSIRKLQYKISRHQIKKRKIPTYGLHYLRNLLHPHEKEQDRVLNWGWFQSQSSENLILACLDAIKTLESGKVYCYTT